MFTYFWLILGLHTGAERFYRDFKESKTLADLKIVYSIGENVNWYSTPGFPVHHLLPEFTLTSLNIIIFRYIHVAVKGIMSFFLMA